MKYSESVSKIHLTTDGNVYGFTLRQIFKFLSLIINNKPGFPKKPGLLIECHLLSSMTRAKEQQKVTCYF
ncbi:hypothetical protein NIES4073_04350 [Kalymmatonema gypsitolerans NIES-4073]|nr:hypothetical protein NIES4073_04350 [Scytonema sp. NIES-4073]